jgi:NADPH:quinone reductase-like Zn-dependent oxidoreductase
MDVARRWVAASRYLTGPQERARAVGAVLGEVSAGRISPRIAGRYPLRRVSEAHARLASRTVLGKLLLKA